MVPSPSRFRRPLRLVVVPALSALAVAALSIAAPRAEKTPGGTGVLLPDGREFVSWERPLAFARTYYVDNGAAGASDGNPGTEERPFLTIGKAAQVLRAGERVLVKTGVYRERVDPVRGGDGPDRLISYEAAPGADVVVKGSRLVKDGWRPSTEWRLALPAGTARESVRIFKRRIDDLDYRGYNPFGIASIMQNRQYLMPKPEELWRHLRRRGMIFVDGRELDQVELYQGLAAAKDGAFWCENDGLTVHLRLPGDADPAGHEIELAIQEQVFAPTAPGIGWIRVKGMTFEHGANGFPVPQRGMVSLHRGHHWIIEDCTIRHANGVGLDIGAQDWDMIPPETIGYAIVRRNHIDRIGVCGIAGAAPRESLIESNLIEHVGGRDVELAWETGGIKLHLTKSCLIRNNVIRHTIHAEAIWLDYENVNTRVTGNVLGDNLKTFRGGVYLEASHEPNMIDGNLIWKSTESDGGGSYNMPGHGGWGITVDGSDDTTVAYNLVGLAQDAAIKFRAIESRIVTGRGGTARRSRVFGNVFYRCGKAIDLANLDNAVDGNVYSREWGATRDENQGVGRGLIWLPDSGTTLRLDLDAARRFFGLEKTGVYADMDVDVDLDALTMTWAVAGAVPTLPAGTHFRRDLVGRDAGATRKPGPLAEVPPAKVTVSIDPRSR